MSLKSRDTCRHKQSERVYPDNFLVRSSKMAIVPGKKITMKRSKYLMPLSQDHYAGLLIADRIHRGLAKKASPEVISAYVAHFWESQLAVHFQQEEALLLPLISELEKATLAKRLVEEHRLIRELVALASDKSEECAPRLLELSHLLKAHIRFEERVLFPALEEQFSEEVLSQIGVQLQDAHCDPDLSWDPAFWE